MSMFLDPAIAYLFVFKDFAKGLECGGMEGWCISAPVLRQTFFFLAERAACYRKAAATYPMTTSIIWLVLLMVPYLVVWAQSAFKYREFDVRGAVATGLGTIFSFTRMRHFNQKSPAKPETLAMSVRINCPSRLPSEPAYHHP